MLKMHCLVQPSQSSLTVLAELLKIMVCMILGQWFC